MQSNTQTYKLDYKVSQAFDADNATTAAGSPSQELHWSVFGKVLSSQLQELVMAVSLTAPVFYSQPTWDLFRTSVYPSVIVGTVREKKRLSLRVARQIALGVLADTESRLWEE